MKKGFTLVEVLIMMLIILVLATIAVPTYEKVIEKARLNEARTTLKRIYDSKMRVLDNLEKTTYDRSYFGFENLDFQFKCQSASTENDHVVACNTDDFTYWISPKTGDQNRVCAVRRKGDQSGTIFTYTTSDITPFRCFTSTGSQCSFYSMPSGDGTGNLCHAIN